MEISAKQLLNHLTLIRSNFAFGIQFWALLRNPKTAESFQIHKIVVRANGIYAIPPGSSMDAPESEPFYKLELGGPETKSFEHASMEFIKLHLRAFVVETFEKLAAHCNLTGQSDALRTCDWYQFARMVRNALAHDQTWRFNKYDRSILPVCWNGKTIDLALDGTMMTWRFFGPYDALELWDEMYEFAKSIC